MSLDNFDRDFRRFKTFVVILWLGFALVFGITILSLMEGIQSEGGLGKTIGHFIGNIQEGIKDTN